MKASAYGGALFAALLTAATLTVPGYAAKKHGRKVDGVAIPPPLNKSDVVRYAIGA